MPQGRDASTHKQDVGAGPPPELVLAARRRYRLSVAQAVVVAGVAGVAAWVVVEALLGHGTGAGAAGLASVSVFLALRSRARGQFIDELLPWLSEVEDDERKAG